MKWAFVPIHGSLSSTTMCRESKSQQGLDSRKRSECKVQISKLQHVAKWHTVTTFRFPFDVQFAL
jgi:hypothetical protein